MIDDGGRLGNNSVAFLPTGDIRTEFHDVSAKFVAEDDGIVHRPGMIPGPLVKIAAAHSDVGDLKENFIGADGGTFDFAEFDRS